MDEEAWCEDQMVLPLEGSIPCYVCGQPTPADNEEACDLCMNPEFPTEKWYYDGPGDEPGWQDSTFPNEY